MSKALTAFVGIGTGLIIFAIYRKRAEIAEATGMDNLVESLSDRISLLQEQIEKLESKRT